ncbi:MAG: PAS domain-containing protein [Candidatus Eisenbacteria bacterium]|uniref:PAS domain-containing protein n=1 Tax=Eiseniibacteriota bacterium TaxID=2212470 RepID=A0A538SV61_UNCEI|nr:MAG: PAS domain-containing protein [Candidatus Eisenbacteria bacterium]
MILGRVVLLVLVTVMAVVFSGASLGFDRQFPFWFFLFAVGVLGLAYRRVLRSGGDTKTLLATQFIVDVGTTSYLVFFTGGAESQFVPLYLLSPLLGGIFLSVRGGVFLAAAASMAYAGFYLAARQGLMPSMGYGMTQGLGDGAILLRVLLYVPLLFVVGVIGGRLGRRIQEGRRALETARAELNRALFDTESILENMSSGLVTVDADGVVRHWNRAASEISGCAVDAMRSRPYVDALGPGLAEFTIRMRDALEHGAPSSRAEITITKPDGTKVPLGISTSLLRDPDGRRRGVIGLFQDLSEVRALEERIRRRETLAAIGELSAGIAHEIRNCLNPISGSVEVLQRELKVKGENARLLDLVVRESERLDNFIRELLDYARERPLKCEDLDLESLLTDIVDVARRHPSAEGKTLRFVGQGESVYRRPAEPAGEPDGSARDDVGVCRGAGQRNRNRRAGSRADLRAFLLHEAGGHRSRARDRQPNRGTPWRRTGGGEPSRSGHHDAGMGPEKHEHGTNGRPRGVTLCRARWIR